MKKIFEAAFIGAVAYLSGQMYEQGRKSGKDSKVDPKAFAAGIGSRLPRAQFMKLIADLQKRAQEQSASE